MRRVSKNIYKLVGLLAVAIFLIACGKESEAKIMVENFNIVDPYDYDKIKVVVDEEKTPEQVARDILQEEMGLNTQPKTNYDEYGISPKNGLFVNSAILDGPEIPDTPGFDINLYLGQKGTDTAVEDYIYTKYDELQQRRESVLAQNTETRQVQDIAEDLQKRLAEQEQTIYQQQEKAKQQEELYPELFPKIVIQE